MTFIRFLIVVFFVSNSIFASGYDVFGIGYYDVKFDGSSTNIATYFRYERRFDKVLVDIGPEEDNYFYLKPFAGIEATSKSSYYILGGIYLEDNLGQLFIGDRSNFIFIPSFGAGYYDGGNGNKLGSKIEFRTAFEISYEMQNKNRIGLSFSHISNSNISNTNPGVEIISLSYQIPY